MKKQKTLRQSKEFPGLDKSVNTKMRQDLLDYDYLDKLSEKDKEYLNNFTLEYVNADFAHEGKRIHKKKIKKRKIVSTRKFKKYDVSKKACEDANNSRNACIYTRSKAMGTLDYSPTIKREARKKDDVEDTLIDLIDLKKILEET